MYLYKSVVDTTLQIAIIMQSLEKFVKKKNKSEKEIDKIHHLSINNLAALEINSLLIRVE